MQIIGRKEFAELSSRESVRAENSLSSVSATVLSETVCSPFLIFAHLRPRCQRVRSIQKSSSNVSALLATLGAIASRQVDSEAFLSHSVVGGEHS